MKTPEFLKEINKYVTYQEKECQKRIDDEKNPILKMMRQDQRKISKLTSLLWYFEQMYGIEIEWKIRTKKAPESHWGESIMKT